jgi:hypothetical protein
MSRSSGRVIDHYGEEVLKVYPVQRARVVTEPTGTDIPPTLFNEIGCAHNRFSVAV